MGILHYMISARFIVTMGHLTALLILFATIDSNVEVSLADNSSSSDKQRARESAIAALCFGVFCFALDFSGMFFGTTMFSPAVNLTQIVFHFIGSIFLSWLITDNWSYHALWPIVVSCNIPTALIEIMYLLSLHVFRTTVY